MLNKNSFLTAILQRYSSTVVVQLAGFLVGLTVAKILGPELLGYWGIFQIITGYFSYSNLGATNGLTRDLGIALGERNKKQERIIIGAAHAVQVTLPLLATITLFVAALFYPSPMNWILVTSGIFGFLQLYEVTLERIINAYEQHKKIALLHGGKAIITIFIVIPLVWFFELEGRLIAAVILSFIVFIATWHILPVKMSLKFDKEAISSLLKIGFPIGMAGFLMTNFFLVDRLVITKFLTLEQLGFYVFAFYLVKIIKSIKQTVSSILYQRQNIIYGEDGPDKKRRLFIISKSAAYFTTDITGVLAGLILIAFSFAVIYIMPEYKESISLTYIIVFSQVMGSINVLNTVGEHIDYLKLLGGALLINILLSLSFVQLWGLMGVAYATFISFFIHNILVNTYNLRYFGVSFKKTWGVIFRISGVPVFCYLVAYVIEIILFKQYSGSLINDLLLGLGLITVYLLLTAPLLYFLKQHVSVLNRIKLLKT